MPPLTTREIADHANRLLAPVTGLVTKQLGHEAATHAGYCLMLALKKYDTDRGSIEGFIKSKVLLLVMDELREIHGRKGTAKHDARAGAAYEFDELQASVEATATERLDDMRKVAERINRFRHTKRFIIMGASFGFTKKSLSRIIRNACPRTIRKESSELRELLSVN